MKRYNDTEYQATSEMAHVTLDGWDGQSYNGEGRNLRVYTKASCPGAKFIRLPFNGSRCYHKLINEFHPKSGVQMVEFFEYFDPINI